jgi:hypothetical protein
MKQLKPFDEPENEAAVSLSSSAPLLRYNLQRFYAGEIWDTAVLFEVVVCAGWFEMGIGEMGLRMRQALRKLGLRVLKWRRREGWMGLYRKEQSKRLWG